MTCAAARARPDRALATRNRRSERRAEVLLEADCNSIIADSGRANGLRAVRSRDLPALDG